MARKLKRKKKSESSIETNKLLTMLKQIWLQGVLNECVIEVKHGKATVEAVDMTNTLVVLTTGMVMTKDTDTILGLGNLELLINFLSSLEDKQVSFKKSSNHLSITRQDGRRKLDYLTTEPDLIATRLIEDDNDAEPYDTYSAMTEFEVELSPTFIKDFLTYVGLLKTKDATLIFDGEEEVKFSLGDPDEHQFEITLNNEVESEAESDPFKVLVNGEHLSHVFKIIDYDEKDPPIMKFAEDVPIMVEYKKTAWALLPIVEESE
jgi:hypothetical protein